MINLKETWKDPVWSKVIAQGILYAIALFCGAIYWIWSKIPLLELLTSKIEFYWLLIGFGTLLLFNIFISITKPRPIINKKEQAIANTVLQSQYNLHGDFSYSYKIVFNEGLDFSLKDLTAYCNKHNTRMKLVETAYDLRCPYCSSSMSYIDLSKAEHIIESMILDHISRLKNSY